MSDNLVQILRDLGALKAGQTYSREDGQRTIDWVGEPIAGICRQAADEIERLRSLLGAVTPGQSVADIKEYLRNVPKKELSSDAGEKTAP
jgi:hypothetical protein